MYCCAWCRHFRNTEKEGSDGYCSIDGTEVRLEDVCDEFEGKRGNKMTNEEWLNTLSTEEKAKVFARSCNLCSYDSDNSDCSDSFNVCKNGIKEWLNKKHIEPIPKIQAGDIFLYTEKSITHFGVCVYGNFLYLPDKGRCCYFDGEIKENIVTIKRYDIMKGTMEEIWRADDEQL